MTTNNPLLALPFEPSLEYLGSDYWDVVEAACFPETRLRFRNDALLQQLGLDPSGVSRDHLEAAYGRFEGRQPLLALRYHGYQFGVYNPQLGDGRGFLYGQVRDRHGQLQDLGTKGSGQTPWSRGGDGRLTLKGGVREVIAAEALHRLGVTTSRTMILIETGEQLYRGDEPSPTRSSVMVRLAKTHLRFGSCERLLYLQQPGQLVRLLHHVQRTYYPHLAEADNPLLAMVAELVERVAHMAAQWMVAGFTHGVLNTDNMSLAGESFDYGPYGFLGSWDPGFTAAYFDHTGLYAYGRQPAVCHHNLKLLLQPLAMALPLEALEATIAPFGSIYGTAYRAGLLRRLGLAQPWATVQTMAPPAGDLVSLTLQLLAAWRIDYGDFFAGLRDQVSRSDLEEPDALRPWHGPEPPRQPWLAWRDCWWSHWHGLRGDGRQAARWALQRWNLTRTPTRPVIEQVWQAISDHDNWEPFHQLVDSWRWTGAAQPEPAEQAETHPQDQTHQG
ncbi:MAG: YdiU family protein [Synechococcus sp. SB0678_bin_12]|nr:YdiU family protein [Synechococcus sp. SB0678_bin_12]MYI88203.1 YdiU family protein [Synechococcus sp. SB0672_bin_10]